MNYAFHGGKMRRAQHSTVAWPGKGYATGVLLDGASDVAISGNVLRQRQVPHSTF